MQDEDWNDILKRIRGARCTPFLGAGINSGARPAKRLIARKLGDRHGFPLRRDSEDLPSVAQFIGVIRTDLLKPREETLAELAEAQPPDFANPPDFKDRNQPHCILAHLPLPIYMTTNYDGFMFRALEVAHKDPKREICRWNEFLSEPPSVLDNVYEPTVANPVVFHLHGSDERPESLVLTEDDYLDFLVNTSKESSKPKPIPTRIERALTQSSFLFLGYRLPDLEFRVLLRSLVGYMKKSMTKNHFSILQVSDTVSAEEIAKVQDYLSKYCLAFNIKVYWGETVDFLRELRDRWGRNGP